MEKKVTVITGASSGIGAAIATHFASLGYKKLVLVARRKERLDQVKEECLKNGATDVLLLEKDLSKPKESCESIVEATITEFGQLDILICNAGRGEPMSARDFELDAFQSLFDLNFVSCAMLTKFALPHLEKTKGNIIYMSSVLAKRVALLSGAYNASKAALSHYAKTVAIEEAAKGIRVNCINPAGTKTEIAAPEEAKQKSKGEAEKESFQAIDVFCKNWHPLGGIGEAIDVAKVTAFVVSDDNRYMTGSEVFVDGGFMLTNAATMQNA